MVEFRWRRDSGSHLLPIAIGSIRQRPQCDFDIGLLRPFSWAELLIVLVTLP
jgi:hypothetical protein